MLVFYKKYFFNYVMNIEQFCANKNLTLVENNFDSIIECVMYLLKDMCTLEYCHHIINNYIKDNFYSSRVQRFVFKNQTIQSLQNDVINFVVNDHIALQALSTHLEIEIHLLSQSRSKIQESIHPKIEPELTYKKNKTLYIFKTCTNICYSYIPLI